MEIMGLAIVVVLLTLAILFTIQFVYLKPEQDVKASYEASQLATNTVNSLLQTTTECSSHSIRELLANCALNPPTGTILCGSMSSCEYVAAQIDYMLIGTLDAWHRSYNLTARMQSTGEVIMYNDRGSCSGERDANVVTPVPTNRGTLNVRLDICS